MRRLSVAASCGETPDSSNRVSQRQAGRKRVARAESGHMVLTDIPRRSRERSEQSSGKNSSGLQRADAENLARMGRVFAPVINDVEDFGADDSAQHNQNSEIPRLLTINAQPLGVAHADPEAKQYAERNQEAVCRQKKASEMH